MNELAAMMRKTMRSAAWAGWALLASSLVAAAQAPVCQRLEGQLAAIDRGTADPARADQIRRIEDASNRQQFELDKVVAQSRRAGCEQSGLFSIFSSQPPQCAALERQIQQLRGNLDRTTNDLQHLQGNLDRGEQRRGVLVALADNNCGPQYRSAALGGSRNFFDTLFGGGQSSGGQSAMPAEPVPTSGARTLCVRTCDGYYFPVSAAVARSGGDGVCQRLCPAAEAALYSQRSGEEVAQAVSTSGRPYSELPAAFRYRQSFDQSCSCRQSGQSWSDALKNLDDGTIEQGDIVVTEERAKRLSLPQRDAQGRATTRQDSRGDRRQDQRAGEAKLDPKTTGTTAPPVTDDKPIEIAPGSKGPVRTVGPLYLPPQR